MIRQILQPCNHQSPSWPRPEGPSCGGRRGPKTLCITIPRHIHATILTVGRALSVPLHPDLHTNPGCISRFTALSPPMSLWAVRSAQALICSRGESAPSRPSFQSLSSEAMASGRQALEPSGRLSLGGHRMRKNVLWGAGKRTRSAST